MRPAFGRIFKDFIYKRLRRVVQPAFGRIVKDLWAAVSVAGQKSKFYSTHVTPGPAGRPSAGFSKILYISGFAASFGRPSAGLSKIFGRRFPLQVENPNSTQPMLLHVIYRSYMPSFMIVRLQTSEIKRGEINFLGGGFRCSSKILILLDPCYSM